MAEEHEPQLSADASGAHPAPMAPSGPPPPANLATADMVIDELTGKLTRYAIGLIGAGLLGALSIAAGTYVQIQAQHAHNAAIHAEMRADILDLREDVGAVQALEREVSGLSAKVDASSTETLRSIAGLRRAIERLQDRAR